MVNQSKANDPRCWATWKASTAVETIEDAINRDRELRDLGVEIFERKPLRYDSGLPIYTPNTVQDLVSKEFPTRIIQGRWANNLRFSDVHTAKIARDHPTHILFFSPIPDGNYRLDVQPA